jgi:uncharacterized protein YndB with AHSA1/START domain
LSADRQRLTLTRLLPAGREEIFAAWTNPESVRRWMAPDDLEVAFVEMDVRVGGAFRIDMQRGGERLVHRGTYREIVPPRRLVFTWVSRDTYDGETLVEVDLRERENQTELTLTQTLLPDPDSAARHTRGWSQILMRLVSWLEECKCEVKGKSHGGS